MSTEPKIERRKKQHYVAIRLAVPIPFGKYLQPAWNEVYEWMIQEKVTPAGPAIIRYLTTDMSKKLDIDVGFAIDKAVKGNERILVDTLPAGRYATPVYTGPYKGKGIFKATVALLEWAKENKVKWDTSKKKASNGGMGGRSSIFPTLRLKKTRRSSRRNWHSLSNKRRHDLHLNEAI